MDFGSWNINVNVGGMPQKIATAMSSLNEMVGAEYEPIAYLGSQLVNGTNHALLAKQTIIAGKDTQNIVVVIFNETKEGVTLVNIERVVESGGELGGVQISSSPLITEDAQKTFDEAFRGFVGSDIEPFALVGTQMTKGLNYIFVAKITPIVVNPVETVALVVVNSMTKDVSFVDLLTSKNEVMSLGYAFTWLRRQNTSLGKPLGEWP